MKEYRATIDFVMFNLCWMANAVSGLYPYPYAGPLVVVLAVFVHLTLITNRLMEGLFLVVVSITGYLWDTLILRLGLIGFPTSVAGGVAPLWLFAQWIAFGLLFRHSIRWLRSHGKLAALLGAIGGPLSYYSATRLNVLELGQPRWLSIIILAGGWALIVPVFGHLSKKYEQLRIVTPDLRKET